MAIFVNENESEHARILREAKQKKQREEAEHFRRMIGLDKVQKGKEKEDANECEDNI